MPTPSDLGFTFRIQGPSVLARGRGGVVRMEARLAGEVVAPTEGTFALLDEVGAEVAAGAVTIGADSIAEYELEAADLPATLALAPTYRERWDLVIDGRTYTVERSAVVARRALLCPVTQADLLRRYPNLDASGGRAAPSLQHDIDEAWVVVVQRLIQGGQWPEAVVDQDALREPVLELALAYRFGALALVNPTMAEREQRHLRAYEAAFAAAAYRRDSDGDGVADSQDRTAAAGPVTRNGSPAWFYGSRSGARGRRAL